jgi:hypothetical protein
VTKDSSLGFPLRLERWQDLPKGRFNQPTYELSSASREHEEMSADPAPIWNRFLTWMSFGSNKTVDAAVQGFEQVEVSAEGA